MTSGEENRIGRDVTFDELIEMRRGAMPPQPDDPDLCRVFASAGRHFPGFAQRELIVPRTAYAHARARDTEFVDGLAGPEAWVTTFDHIEHEPIEIAVTSCGLPACRCALAWRPVERRHTHEEAA